MKRLIYFEDAAFDAQTVSIDFDGSTEYMMHGTSDVDFDAVNNWTLSVWIKPVVDNVTGRIINSSSRSGFNLESRSSPTGRFRFGLWDSAQSNKVRKEYDNVIVPGAWTMLTIYRNGTSANGLYVNGGFKSPDNVIRNNSFGAADDGRRIAVAANWPTGGTKWPGRVHSVAFWNVTLTSGEVLEVYNGGSGSTMDLGNDKGNYVSSANLQHWWRLGHDSSNIGRDYGYHAALKDLDFNPNIAVSDIVADAP